MKNKLGFCDRNEHRDDKDQNILDEKGEFVVSTTDKTFSSKGCRNFLSNAIFYCTIRVRRTLILLGVITALLSIVNPVAYSFKDLSSEADDAAEKLSEEGMFGSFIYKYGDEFFRPDGYVTRENLVLILKEYHILTQKLLMQNVKLALEVEKMKKKSSSPQNIDLLLREFQKMLDPMLRKSSTILALRKQIVASSGKEVSSEPSVEYISLQSDMEELSKKVKKMYSAIGGIDGITPAEKDSLNEKKMDNMINDLKNIKISMLGLKKNIYLQKKKLSGISKEQKTGGSEFTQLQDMLESLSKKVEGIEKFSEERSGKNNMESVSNQQSGKEIKQVTEDLEGLKKRVFNIQKDLYLQKKNISGISKEGAGSSKELESIQESIDRLKAAIDVQKKQISEISEYKSAGQSSGVLSSENLEEDIVSIKSNIMDLEKNLNKHEKYIKKNSFKHSGTDGIIPFWVKVSLGFSTLALFFMAR